MPTYTEGVCSDGAAIMKDGRMMPITEVLQELNEAKSGCRADVQLNDLLNACNEKEARIKTLEEALHLYIDAGCMEGAHFVLQKNALDNALELLGI